MEWGGGGLKNGVTVDNKDRLSEILLAMKERDRYNEGTVKKGKVRHGLGRWETRDGLVPVTAVTDATCRS